MPHTMKDAPEDSRSYGPVYWILGGMVAVCAVMLLGFAYFLL